MIQPVPLSQLRPKNPGTIKKGPSCVLPVGFMQFGASCSGSLRPDLVERVTQLAVHHFELNKTSLYALYVFFGAYKEKYKEKNDGITLYFNIFLYNLYFLYVFLHIYSYARA